MSNKIKYSEEFKTKCFNNLRYFMDIRLLISAMDNGHDNVVRYYLEEALDDSELYVNDEITDDGERRIANAKIHAYTIRHELYNEFMELLTETLDNKNVRSELLPKRRDF